MSEPLVEENGAPAGPLTRANAQIHEAHDEALLVVIEQLTSLEIDAARAGFRQLHDDMAEHLRREEAEGHRRYALLGDHPRGAGPELFEADHVSQDKVTATCLDAIERLDVTSTALRRQGVLALPLFYRLRNVLEHHTLREQRFLYPRLDEVLGEEAASAMATSLISPGGS